MNYPDEDYVRFYTRDTVTWLALEYEGQAVLSLMLHGRFNRSGVFDCGGHLPSHAVTLATRCPADVAEKGLERLVATKTWVVNDGQIIWPNYVYAQCCRRSDRARKRESRENLAHQAMGTLSPGVTSRHQQSPLVTPKPKPKPKPKQKGRERAPTRESNGETKIPTETRPVPVATEPPNSPAATSGLSLQERAWLWVNNVTKASFEAQPHPSCWDEIHALDARLRERFGITNGTPISRQPRTLGINDPRVEMPVRRLAEGISLQDLLDAIDGSVGDPYLKDHPAQRSVRWILGNAERVGEFMLRAREKAEPVTVVRPTRRKPDPTEDALAARTKERLALARENATPEELALAEGTAKAVASMAGSLFKP